MPLKRGEKKTGFTRRAKNNRHARKKKGKKAGQQEKRFRRISPGKNLPPSMAGAMNSGQRKKKSGNEWGGKAGPSGGARAISRKSSVSGPNPKDRGKRRRRMPPVEKGGGGTVSRGRKGISAIKSMQEKKEIQGALIVQGGEETRFRRRGEGAIPTSEKSNRFIVWVGQKSMPERGGEKRKNPQWENIFKITHCVLPRRKALPAGKQFTAKRGAKRGRGMRLTLQKKKSALSWGRR